MKEVRTYCSFCSLRVPEKEPGRVKKGDKTYHQNCWLRKLRRDFEYAEQDALQLAMEERIINPNLRVLRVFTSRKNFCND